jgi:hypothetical protein
MGTTSTIEPIFHRRLSWVLSMIAVLLCPHRGSCVWAWRRREWEMISRVKRTVLDL